jgi:hypothetical protein
LVITKVEVKYEIACNQMPSINGEMQMNKNDVINENHASQYAAPMRAQLYEAGMNFPVQSVGGAR